MISSVELTQFTGLKEHDQKQFNKLIQYGEHGEIVSETEVYQSVELTRITKFETNADEVYSYRHPKAFNFEEYMQ